MKIYAVFKRDKWGLNSGKLYEGTSKFVVNALKKQHKVNIFINNRIVKK